MTQRNIPEDSIGKKVAAGAMYLFTEITQSPMPHNASWDLCFSDPVLVPWIMSKSKVNGVSKFTWPPPGPSMTTATFRPAIPTLATKGRVCMGYKTIRWNDVSELPASLSIIAANGILVKKISIRSVSGQTDFIDSHPGVYIAALEPPRQSGAIKSVIIIPTGVKK